MDSSKESKEISKFKEARQRALNSIMEIEIGTFNKEQVTLPDLLYKLGIAKESANNITHLIATAYDHEMHASWKSLYDPIDIIGPRKKGWIRFKKILINKISILLQTAGFLFLVVLINELIKDTWNI